MYTKRAVAGDLYKLSARPSINTKPAIIFLDLIIEAKEAEIVEKYQSNTKYRSSSLSMSIEEIVSNIYLSIDPEHIPLKSLVSEVLDLKSRRISVFPEIRCETNNDIKTADCERTCYCTDAANPSCCCLPGAAFAMPSFKEQFLNNTLGVIAFWDCFIYAYDSAGDRVLPQDISMFIPEKGVKIITFRDPNLIKSLEISDPSVVLQF
jgi:hypothetical protein